MNKTSTGFAPFSTTANRFFASFLPTEKDDSPGPGEYTLKNFATAPSGKKSKSKGKFGSNEKRFSDILSSKWKYCVPGPGYYNPEEVKTQSFRPFKTFYKTKFFNLNKNKDLQIKKVVLNSKDKIKEKAPPIGLYNPDMIFSIDYKNKKKVFETKKNKVAFDSTYNKKSKHKKVQLNNNLGPGYYYHEKVERNLKPSPQFYLSENKTNCDWFKDSNPNIGPGKYDINNYFDWNKKSFNINFI